MPVGQTSKGAGNPVSSISTTGVVTQPGSALVALLVWDSSSTFTSISDTINGGASGNTWVLIGSEQTYSTARTRAYYVTNANGGSNHVVTFTPSASCNCVILFVEITGIPASDAVDGTPSFVADASSPFTSGNVTTSTAGAMLVGGLVCNSGSNPATHAISSATPSSGWTIQSGAEETNGASFYTGCLATQVVSSTGTYNSGFTESGGSDSSVLLIAFKQTPIITSQPSNAEEYNGNTAAFSVSATGGSLSYQWQVSTNRGVSYSNVGGGSGATSASYTTATLAFSDNETFYRCAVTDSIGTTNTRGASLRIRPRATGAWIRS